MNKNIKNKLCWTITAGAAAFGLFYVQNEMTDWPMRLMVGIPTVLLILVFTSKLRQLRVVIKRAKVKANA